jgi:Lambda phage tail tube protein, TTP
MSDAKLFTGTLLKVGDGASPEVFTTIAEIANLEPAELSRNEIDVSIHNEGEESILTGMLRKGKVNVTINYLPSNATHNFATGLLDAIYTNERRNYRIVWPASAGASYWEFEAYVTNFKPMGGGLDIARQAQVGLRMAGTISISDSAEA